MTQGVQGTVTSTPATVNLNGATNVGAVINGSWGGVKVGPTFIPASALAGGTVTRVAMTVPSILAVAGSPVTTTGTFALTLATQTANTVFAGPTSGGALAPTFRALVAADIPAAYDALVVHLAGPETITGIKTFTANPVFNAAAIPQAAVATLVSDLALKATDSLVVHLAGIETITGAKTFSAALTASVSVTTALLNITGGAANTLLGTTGSSTFFQANSLRVWGATTDGLFSVGDPTAAGSFIARGTSGYPVFCRNVGAIASQKADGKPTFATEVSVTGGSASVTAQQSNFAFTSFTNATTRTLPTPANSYVGQTLTFIQEASHVFTVTGPSGVSVTMLTGTNTFTTKTAGSFVTAGSAGTDSTSATLICTATDASTVATWRQIGGTGIWT